MVDEAVDLHLTTKIFRSYVRHHRIEADQVSQLITSVHRVLGQLGQPVQPEEVRTPAVSVRQSVRHDYVVCLDCGYRGKMLQRHVARQHGLSRHEYLQRWGLRSDHPLTAPAYSERRSIMAKELGFGRKSAAQVAAAVTPTSAPRPLGVAHGSDPTPTRERRSRSVSKSADVTSEVVAATPARRKQSRTRVSSPKTQK